MRPKASLAAACTLAPSGNHHVGMRLWMDVSDDCQVAAGCLGRRNGSPERQMLCMIIESFRASATRALPAPDRLAIACAHSFKPHGRLTRVISTTAASYISVRASVSPHFDSLPLRSISPD